MMRGLAVAVLVSSSVLGGAGCNRYTGPGEKDALPEASLTFPGATETRRSFLEADDDRGIDGNDLSNPATLTRTLEIGVPAPPAEVLDWYRQRLTGAGWSRNAETEESIDYSKNAGGINHSYSVHATPTSPEGRTTKFEIAYFMD